jgi:hypothetical protein
MKAALPVIIGAIAIGSIARLSTGTPVLQTDLAPAAVAGAPARSGTPESAVLSFYERLARGQYDKAWELSVEPSWKGARGTAYRDAVTASGAPDGWTPEKVFVARCADDIGEPLKLNGITAAPLSAAPGGPEVSAAAARANGRVFGVHASGQMLGACVIYRWDKDLIVAEIDGAWKVVLPGTRPAKSFFHQAWFSNMTMVASLRASGN